MGRVRIVEEGDAGQVLGGAGQVEGVAVAGGVLGEDRRAVEQGQGQLGPSYRPGAQGGVRFKCLGEQQSFEPDEFGRRRPGRFGVEDSGQRAQSEMAPARCVGRSPASRHIARTSSARKPGWLASAATISSALPAKCRM
ncbi:hypothetical protein ACH4U6_17495 [Streptomyces netropsis]|uniref:hypothetical protein n=1 Tax=Streptomyces netropsis TaxID=55404 RepID=UPI00379DEE4D